MIHRTLANGNTHIYETRLTRAIIFYFLQFPTAHVPILGRTLFLDTVYQKIETHIIVQRYTMCDQHKHFYLSISTIFYPFKLYGYHRYHGTNQQTVFRV